MSSSQTEATSAVADRLLALLAKGTEGFTSAMLGMIIEQTTERSPTLAALIREGAIPRRLDLAIVAALRETAEDDPENADLMRQLAAFSFIRANPDGSLEYHDTTRDELLRDWQRDDQSRARFQAVNARLVDYFGTRLEDATRVAGHLAAAGPVIRDAHLARYVQVAAAVDRRLIAAVTELLYHETLGDPLNAIDTLQRYYHRYERQNRFYVCRALLQSEKDWIESRPPGQNDPVLLAWLHYYEARLAGLMSGPQDAIEKLQALRKEPTSDRKLEIWVLSQLGIEFHKLNRLREARQAYEQELLIARETQLDPFNTPTTLGRLANVIETMGNLQEARRGYQEAFEEARRVGSDEGEIHWLTSLADVLWTLGQTDQALDVAADAFDRARTTGLESLDVQGTIGSLFMMLLMQQAPETADTAYREALAAKRALADIRDETQLRIDRARALSESSQFRRAEESLQQLHKRIAQQPHTDERVQQQLQLAATLAEADVALRCGQYERAVELFASALRQAGTDERFASERALALAEGGKNLARLGQLDEAREKLEAAAAAWHAIGRRPYAALQQARLGSVARRRGDLEEAERLLTLSEKGLGGSPPVAWEAEISHERGELARATGRWSSAARAFEGAANGWHRASRELLAAADVLELSRVAAAAADANAASNHAYRALGLLRRLQRLQRYKPASAADEADHQDVEGLTHLSRDDGMREALQHFQAARDRAPANCWYGLNVAYTAARLGDWNEAATSLARVLRGPRWASRHVFRRRLLEFQTQVAATELDSGRMETALRKLRKVLEQLKAQPAVGCLPETGLRLGDALFSLGQLDSARAAYEGGLRSATANNLPTEADRLTARLGIVEAVRGQVPAAARLLRDSLLSRRRRGVTAPASQLLEDCAAVARSVPGYLAAHEVWSQLVAIAPDQRRELYDAWLDFALGNLASLLRTVPERQQSESSLERVMPARIQLSLANALVPEGENTPGLRWMLDEGLGAMRRAIQEASGVVVPPVMLDADPTLDPDSYRIVIDHELVKTEPAGSHAPHKTIVLRLQAELARWLHRFVGLTDLPEQLRRWAGDSPERNELIRRVLGSDELLQRTAGVTVALIRESIPIRDLDKILGVILSDEGRRLSGDPLVELVRSALRDVIPGADGRRQLIELAGEVETILRSGLRRDDTGSVVVLPRAMIQQLFEIMVGSLGDRDPTTHAFVVRDPELRRPLRRMVERMSANLAVLAERDLS